MTKRVVVLVDTVAFNVKYVGRTDDALATTDLAAAKAKPVWRIKRIVSAGALKTIEYANNGEYSAVWNDRTSYFGAEPPYEADPGTVVYPSGLRNGGVVTEIMLRDDIWTALPMTPLAMRNAIAVQNLSSVDIKLNYADDVVGYVGMVVAANGGERFYDITDGIPIYAKASLGTPTVTIEELS